jgi:4-hydroxybenzoate polyprenyltransferase
MEAVEIMRKLKAMLRLMRPLQWAKNAFVLAPLFFSKQLFQTDSLVRAVEAFVLFSLIASFLYIVNDWRDVEADRQHVRKRLRPLAAGTVSIGEAALMLAGLAALVLAVLLVMQPGRSFLAVVALYVGSALSYSFSIKHVPLLELFVVASGYVLRVIAGSLAIAVEPSPWILATSGLVAFLIVAGKRRADMANNLDPTKSRQSLSGYTINYLDHIISIAAGMTILSYILFTVSDYAITRFHSQYLVTTSVFVGYGVLRYLKLIMIDDGADNPTELVVRDVGLLASVIAWAVTLLIIIYFL